MALRLTPVSCFNRTVAVSKGTNTANRHPNFTSSWLVCWYESNPSSWLLWGHHDSFTVVATTPHSTGKMNQTYQREVFAEGAFLCSVVDNDTSDRMATALLKRLVLLILALEIDERERSAAASSSLSRTPKQPIPLPQGTETLPWRGNEWLTVRRRHIVFLMAV